LLTFAGRKCRPTDFIIIIIIITNDINSIITSLVQKVTKIKPQNGTNIGHQTSARTRIIRPVPFFFGLVLCFYRNFRHSTTAVVLTPASFPYFSKIKTVPNLIIRSKLTLSEI